MRQLFISYARENRPDVGELVRDLDVLGYQAWVDSSLRGGQTWWEEIVRRIAECDVFVAIVSQHSLNSVACKRELEWALALNKPVLPVAVEGLPHALPRTLAMRQIVDYAQPGKNAAFALAGGLAALPPAPAPPQQLPEPPLAPLSHLSDLVDRALQPGPLSHDQQHQILIQLQPALHSVDSEGQQGGRYVLGCSPGAGTCMPMWTAPWPSGGWPRRPGSHRLHRRWSRRATVMPDADQRVVR